MTDTSSIITLDLPDEVVFKLMIEAHEQDITLNQLFNNILREELEKEEPFAFIKRSSDIN